MSFLVASSPGSSGAPAASEASAAYQIFSVPLQIVKMNAVELARGAGDVPPTPDFFTAPDHHAARMVRDIFADEAVAATMEASMHEEPLAPAASQPPEAAIICMRCIVPTDKALRVQAAQACCRLTTCMGQD